MPRSRTSTSLTGPLRHAATEVVRHEVNIEATLGTDYLPGLNLKFTIWQEQLLENLSWQPVSMRGLFISSDTNTSLCINVSFADASGSCQSRPMSCCSDCSKTAGAPTRNSRRLTIVYHFSQPAEFASPQFQPQRNTACKV